MHTMENVCVWCRLRRGPPLRAHCEARTRVVHPVVVGRVLRVAELIGFCHAPAKHRPQVTELPSHGAADVNLRCMDDRSTFARGMSQIGSVWVCSGEELQLLNRVRQAGDARRGRLQGKDCAGR